MRYRQFFFLLCLALVAGLAYTAQADFATSTSFRLRQVVTPGGGESTSTTFRERSSIGQQGVGISSSTSFILRGGFLYLESVTTTPPSPSSPSTPSPSTSGGGGSNSGGGYFFPPFLERSRQLPSPEIISRCDFNKDKRCNIIDLSILLYYYEQRGSIIALYDLNRSAIVDFPDISILMYYWTG